MAPGPDDKPETANPRAARHTHTSQDQLDTRALEIAAGTERLLEHHLDQDARRERDDREWRERFRDHVDGKFAGVHERINADKGERAARVQQVMLWVIGVFMAASGVLLLAVIRGAV